MQCSICTNNLRTLSVEEYNEFTKSFKIKDKTKVKYCDVCLTYFEE